MVTDAPTGNRTLNREVLLSDRTTSFGDTLQLVFRAKAEYPFTVSDGKSTLHCISWAEAQDRFTHWYVYVPREEEVKV